MTRRLLLVALLAAGTAGAADVDWASAQLVTVQLIDDRFVPEKLSFKRGVPYRLRLENRGRETHEFTAPEFFRMVTARNPEVLEQAGNEVLVPPKEHKELYFVADKPGRYALTCADHEWDDMKGEITVD
jgi:uncharacterized cupredoxin-like copper-binding protein